MPALRGISTIACLALLAFAQAGFAQAPDTSGTVRVTMTMNADGSRTEYKFDDANRKAVATITNADGKLRERIRYQLDEASRFASSRVFGPDGKFRFKSRYKYDSAGRLEEEVQMTDKDAVLSRIVYSYDQSGRQTGYAIYDGNGKLLGRTTDPGSKAPPKSREKK
jgi:hypothetical protein